MLHGVMVARWLLVPSDQVRVLVEQPGAVAQMAEQETLNLEVTSSTPVCITIRSLINMVRTKTYAISLVVEQGSPKPLTRVRIVDGVPPSCERRSFGRLIRDIFVVRLHEEGPCGRSSTAERWTVAPLMRIRLPSTAPCLHKTNVSS